MGREVKRVPFDFDLPIGTTWPGYLNPFYEHRQDCPACKGSGYALMARLFKEQWYGSAPFDPVEYGATPLTIDHPSVQEFAARNVDRDPVFYREPWLGRRTAIDKEAARLFSCWKSQWEHHLIQADVDALIKAGRLWNFTHRHGNGPGWQPIEPAPVVTAEEVNAWSLSGMGHDGTNQSVCVRARCEREGHPVTCAECDGDGDCWPSKAHKALAESWTNIEPPDGEAYQMWETTSEGSPISPPFATAEELARWLADTHASAFGGESATFEQWMRMIVLGWAPSAVMDAGGFRSGVAM